jgi:hypothetical protein
MIVPNKQMRYPILVVQSSIEAMNQIFVEALYMVCQDLNSLLTFCAHHIALLNTLLTSQFNAIPLHNPFSNWLMDDLYR